MRTLFKIIIKYIKGTTNKYKRNNQLNYPFNIKLTDYERKQIKRYWGGRRYLGNKAIAYSFYKSFGLFDTRLMPNDVFAEVERLLNPYRYRVFLQHKCALKYFIPQNNRPVTIFQNIDGHYFDSQDNPISKKEAIELAEESLPFMIKIAVGSGGGRGIQKIKTKEDIKLIDEYGKNFICQGILREHETLSRFNPECINTIRVLSLNINDKCDILSSFVRMGGLGSFVDNLHSSKGTGVLIGLKQDGSFFSFGIDKDYNRVLKSPTGITFDGLKLEYFTEVKEFVKYWHKKSFPFANLIGWDIIIDKNAKPIVLEINLDSADVAAHQIFNGPIFGDRTEEVLTYMRNNPQKKVFRI